MDDSHDQFRKCVQFPLLLVGGPSRVLAVGRACHSQVFDKLCAESGFCPKGVSSVSAKSWPFQGSIPAPVAVNLFQVSGPKIATFWEEKVSRQCQLARVAGTMGKGHVPSAKGLPRLHSGSHAGDPHGMGAAWQRWQQWLGCILLVADFESWSERRLWF